jgi:hypothetical protein
VGSFFEITTCFFEHKLNHKKLNHKNSLPVRVNKRNLLPSVFGPVGAPCPSHYSQLTRVTGGRGGTTMTDEGSIHRELLAELLKDLSSATKKQVGLTIRCPRQAQCCL